MEAESYYLKEVNTLKGFIKASHEKAPCLFILDEIFKGTNTNERIAAGKAVLNYLSEDNNLVLVATHDIELTGLLQDKFDLYHFTEQLQDGQLYFDHKLKRGTIQSNNAIELLALQDYPDSIVKDARNVLDQFTRS